MESSCISKICYGVLRDLFDVPLPWEEWNTSEQKWMFESIEDWWRFIHGVPPEPDKNEYDFMVITNYHKKLDKMLKENPLPVTLINTSGSNSDDPDYILAVPNSVLYAHDGKPVSFSPTQLYVSVEGVRALKDFCKKYLGMVVREDEFQWYLTGRGY